MVSSVLMAQRLRLGALRHKPGFFLGQLADNGPRQIDNRLLRRPDLHNLLDLGYLTVTLD